MSQESMDVVRSGIKAFNRRDVDAILAVTDPDVEWIEDARYPGAETFRGPAGVERSIRKWWDAWEIEVDRKSSSTWLGKR
jgi:ketosteroid isomerase-like protein